MSDEEQEPNAPATEAQPEEAAADGVAWRVRYRNLGRRPEPFTLGGGVWWSDQTELTLDREQYAAVEGVEGFTLLTLVPRADTPRSP